MKHIKSGFIMLILVLIMNGCSKSQQTMQLEKSEWKFRQVGTNDWMPARVPGCVHTDLLENGKIEDPFYRLNEHDLQWIDKVNWEYLCEFKVDKSVLDKDKVEITFNGLDTYAKVFLNDGLILEAENMFRTYVVDCKEVLRQGMNTLHIVFESPITRGIEKYDELDYQFPKPPNDFADIGKVEGEKPVSIFTRKAGYHFGWDWGPRLVTSGIWKPIELNAYNQAKLNSVFVKQGEITEAKAMLKAAAEIEVFVVGTYQLEIEVNGKRFNKEANLQKGKNSIEVPFEIENPELWWPNGLGDQKLYNIEVRFSTGSKLLATEKLRKGLRTIEWVQEEDSIGTSFYAKVNGRPVFMKGANYIPMDIFPTRVSNEQYQHVVQSAKDANMNMLRVWGGGYYENNEFYALCDEMGILVWQDFMFACSMYPGDEAFLNNVRAEAIDNVKRLRNHTCIALWCGNNECLTAWKNWGWDKKTTEKFGQSVADEMWKAYTDLYHELLPEVVEEFDDRFYWPSSPVSAWGEEPKYDHGDMHYWGVWWGKDPFEDYQKMMPRFMSEFGFQSFPDFATVKKYTQPEDYDIYSEVMQSHQRSSIGNATIEEYMLRDYKKPKDFESYLYVSHLLQAQGIAYGIEAQRRNRHRCMGSLYWQINDCWPVASWSSMDYYGRWKALHYKVKKAFENVLVSPYLNGDHLEIHIVSDLLEDFDASLEVDVLDLKGNSIANSSASITVKQNSSGLYASYPKDWTNGHDINDLVLVVKVRKDGVIMAENLMYFVPFKDLALTKPQLSYVIKEVDGAFEIAFETKELAKDVYIFTEIPGFLSDNYFDILPGESVKIIFTYKNPIELNQFVENIKVITLVDSYN